MKQPCHTTCLNLGCGNRYHPDWTNINFTSTGESVIAHNLRTSIPFPDQSFDLVYHSHVLEHFSKTEAEPFIKECYRVLRPQGILRVVVPDLERITKMYLHSINQLNLGLSEWADNYEWIMIEMYDQTVRNQPGGEMINFLSSGNRSNQEFIIERCGIEISNMLSSTNQKSDLIQPVANTFHKYKQFKELIKRGSCACFMDN